MVSIAFIGDTGSNEIDFGVIEDLLFQLPSLATPVQTQKVDMPFGYCKFQLPSLATPLQTLADVVAQVNRFQLPSLATPVQTSYGK